MIMIYHFKMTDIQKFESICNLTTKMVGLQQGSLSFRSRKQDILVPRMVSVMIGIINNIHPTVIAKVIQRDRTSVLHIKKLHDSNYTSFPKYRELYAKVYQAHKEIYRSKKLFKYKKDLIKYLVLSGINMKIEKPEAIIIVKSGKVSCNIETKHILCSDLMNDIKDVLRYHNFTLKINTI